MADASPHPVEPLSADERATLTCVLDAIVPPTPDGRLPGAGTLGVTAHVERMLGTLPDLRALVTEGLRDLEANARRRFDRPFAALTAADRDGLLAEQGFVFAITLHTYIGYYQHERVLAALGLDPRPPHPRGYPMAPSDPGLLDPVRRRGTRYRDADGSSERR
jgi:hypothetical protein